MNIFFRDPSDYITPGTVIYKPRWGVVSMCVDTNSVGKIMRDLVNGIHNTYYFSPDLQEPEVFLGSSLTEAQTYFPELFI